MGAWRTIPWESKCSQSLLWRRKVEEVVAFSRLSFRGYLMPKTVLQHGSNTSNHMARSQRFQEQVLSKKSWNPKNKNRCSRKLRRASKVWRVLLQWGGNKLRQLVKLTPLGDRTICRHTCWPLSWQQKVSSCGWQTRTKKLTACGSARQTPQTI